ncbi:aldose-1-epimerase, partial [Shigella flexneri]
MQITNMHCSGQTVSLAAGDYHATIVTVGAGLAELTFQGCHLVIPHKPEEMPLAHLGKVLIPWPNRIANGCYRYQGQEYQLPINEHSSKAAIHGLLAWRDWQISELTTTSVTLTAFLPPSYGYPFMLASQVVYSLNAHTGLSVEIASQNIGTVAAPYGVGIHPYLTCNLTSVDEY